MFCKHLLGVQKHTTTDGVLLELGMVPLSLCAKKAAVKNWERIRMGKSNLIVIASVNNAEKEELEWITRIKNCLSENGFGYTHIDNNPLGAHKKLYTRLVDICQQTALSNIANPGSKLRTYCLIKNGIGIEKYLTNIRNTNYRISLSKFRLSNHQLMIETGRHNKIPKTERYCPLCPTPVIEDEVHFLINCSSFNTLRKDIFNDNEMLKINYPHHSDVEKFILLMKNPSWRLAKFVCKAMEHRNSLLATH